ncbi:MAG: ParB/RepB/Spo0J family partition protein [Planctomycetota bacterium]|jgi:ParB/RepB/Spo0J family partition protein
MDIARDIPLTDVAPAPVLLRAVNKLAMAYLSMVAELRNDGHFLNAILVRPIEGGYEVVDGMYRWTAAHEAELTTIQCVIREMTDDEAVIKQIQANAGHTDTDPIEFAKHLERVRKSQGDQCTLATLADLVEKPRKWVSQMLNLNYLTRPAKDAVQRGEIPIGNAKLLSKLRPHLQQAYMRDAKLLPTKEFRPIVARAVNEYREDLKRGRMAAYYGGDARPFCRGTTDVLAELESWPNAGPMILKHGCKTPLDGWKLAVQWVMSMDPDSIEARHKRVQQQEMTVLEQQTAREEAREKAKVDKPAIP